jgi:hypothetical protein
MDWLIPERQEEVFKKVGGLIDDDGDYAREVGERQLKQWKEMGVERQQDAKEKLDWWLPFIQERDQLMKENPALSKKRASEKVADRHPELDIKFNTLRTK